MKNKNLQDALDKIEKQFGKESVMLLGNKSINNEAEVFSSGSFVIDDILGIGGYPKGRIIEIFGPESSGKTTLSLHAIAEIQKAGGIAAFIDAEHAIDPKYAKNLGVDIDNLILSQPDSGEQALEIVDTLVKSSSIDLIVVDSVAALVPEAELAGEMKDSTVGAQARLMSKALRKITGSLSKTNTTIIFLNQIREKIGVMFGNPEVTPGGRALKFAASIRLDIRRISSVGQGADITGNNVKVKVVKNKLAPPFKVGTTEIIFSRGISQESEVVDLAEQYGIIDRKGSWYKYKEENLAQGKQRLTELFMKDTKLFEEIKNLTREKMATK